MMLEKLKKLAKAFIKGVNERNQKGCYIIEDGSIFYREYSGLQYARAAAGDPKKVYEFDEDCNLVSHRDANTERVELLSLIADDDSNTYGKAQLSNLSNESLRNLAQELKSESTDKGEGSEGGEDDDDNIIDLDKMNHAKLVEELGKIDPTHEVTKETKAQLKDLIVAANSLTDFEDEKLIAMAKAFAPEVITEEMTNESIVKVLTTEELKAVVLNARDGVELTQEVSDKLFSIEEEEEVDSSNDNDPKVD